MEASSTISTSASSGLEGQRPKVAPAGRHSSSRCSVEAGAPVASASRLAARPVGAASATVSPLRFKIETIPRTMVVLPTPGPPVTTATLAPSASLTASACCRASAIPASRSYQTIALSASTVSAGAGASRRRASPAASAVSAR